MRPQQRGGGSRRMRLIAASVSGTLVSALCVLGATTAGAAVAKPAHASGSGSQGSTCHLASGIKHVVQIGFDNVHFFRDNPNVPSDLEQVPALLDFFEHNGTFMSNNHTPLIAHTADDLLTTATGLYGDRQGDGISNAYQAYNADGSTDPATSFTYWTAPIDDTAKTPNAGHDTNPNLVYSPVPPATASSPVAPTTDTPAPWVPFTRAGCNVGEVATVDQELENPVPDIANFFGPSSPEEQEVQAFSDQAPYYDNPAADYEGLAVHCAKDAAFCSDAEAVKYGQTTPSHTEAPDILPDEPGGYQGYDAIFGSKYLTPLIGGGNSSSSAGVPVSDASGNLTDEFGNTITEPYATPAPYAGFPGYGEINAAQSLSYAADMLEHGVQVVNLYIADLHGNEGISGNLPANDPGITAACKSAPDALGSGSACYVDQAKYYNDAFELFFKRLAADGITPKNTLFVLSSDEGDHEAGANVGRALQPSPAGCDGVTVTCNYTSADFGELAGNVTGLLAAEGNTTPFSLEPDTAPEFYLTGNPGADTAVVRDFEHSVASLTADDPYTGNPSEKLADYLADPTEEAILHFVDADPARTPTLAMFANPDYYLETGKASCTPTGLTGCVTQDDEFAWDHGDYAAEINTNYAAFAGPGVRQLGLDGPAANQGPSSAGANSGLTVVSDYHFRGPWLDETDIRPTMMYLLGLRDDYEHDGRVITQILSHPNHALSRPGVTRLGECYKQLNSSVGDFGSYTLSAATAAIESNSAGDSTYLHIDAALRGLEVARDHLALFIKGELEAAAFSDATIHAAGPQIGACQALIYRARKLAAAS